MSGYTRNNPALNFERQRNKLTAHCYAQGDSSMWFIVVVVFAVAVVFIVNALDDYVERRVRAARSQSFFKQLSHAHVSAELAEMLEIQADGGDSPADFVQYAIEECWKNADKNVGA